MGTKNQRTEPEPYVIPLSLDTRETLSFAPERAAGWAAYFSDDLDAAGMGVQLRIGPRRYEGDWDDELARKSVLDPPVIPANVPLEVRQVNVTTQRGANLRSHLLRSIPFERIEAAVNRPVHRDVISEWLLPAVIAGDTAPTSVDWKIRPGVIHPAPAKPRRPQLKLRIPEGYRKPDQFYADVADRFLWLATFSSRPAQELAEANDVKPGSVHRWIREAKARGLLVLPDRGTE